ncbi:MAG: TetR family transcriptional regulator [Microbacteriaceae bacterium]|jgi:TetR/AcrR family transcriptional regulator|nr:TetR family transcriptional regulator [Microbacteriaceae bacterium]HEV7956065.1 TetR/AcrR family transcriptional regulator [Marisediminicola sp.]
MSSAIDLREIALAEFATAGYAGTSIHRIADLAGLSKSSVLYHYASKETLLEAAIGPAIDRMEAMIEDLASHSLHGAARARFLTGFTEFLLEHRLEVHMFINQGSSLVDVPVVERANDVVRQLADYFASNTASTEDKMRFGIALGGAAYTLCMQQSLGIEPAPVEETRAALVTIMTELLAPVHIRPSA